MATTGRATGVLLISSSGGVLLDLLALRPWWENRRPRWVAVSAPDTRELLSNECVTWRHELRPSSLGALGLALVEAFMQLRASPPEVVVSAGSGVAVPWFLAARICKLPCVWIETFNVLGCGGLASRLCRAVASTVVVQHQDLVADHPRAVFVGELY